MTADQIIQWLDRHQGTLARAPSGWVVGATIRVAPYTYQYLHAAGPTAAEAVTKLAAKINTVPQKPCRKVTHGPHKPKAKSARQGRC